MLGNILIAPQLTVSQEGLSSMNLFAIEILTTVTMNSNISGVWNRPVRLPYYMAPHCRLHTVSITKTSLFMMFKQTVVVNWCVVLVHVTTLNSLCEHCVNCNMALLCRTQKQRTRDWPLNGVTNDND
jgi:hypothetical protein